MHSLRACSLLLGCALVACADGTTVELGQIEADGAPLRIGIPASATIGQSVLVGLVTYGDGCVSFEETQVTITEHGADITPYDRRTLEAECPLILRAFDHDATVRFETAGSKVIRLTGRATGTRGGDRFDEVRQLAFPLTVE